MEHSEASIGSVHVEVNVGPWERAEEPQRELLELAVFEDVPEPLEITPSVIAQASLAERVHSRAHRVEMLVERFRGPQARRQMPQVAEKLLQLLLRHLFLREHGSNAVEALHNLVHRHGDSEVDGVPHETESLELHGPV